MTMSKPSMQLSFADLGSLPEDTLAHLFHKPGSVEARKTTVTSGRRCSELFASADPLGSVQRMLLDTSAWVSTKCWLTWKVKTTPAGRLLFQLVPRMHHTDEIESGLWATPRRMIPTPTASDHIERESSSSEAVNPLTGKSVSLDRFVRFWPTEEDQKSGIPQMWPTPTARDGKSGKGKQPRQFSELNSTVERMWPTPTASDSKFQSLDVAARNQKIAEEAGGSLNPQWVEWLMGYPSGWTDLED